jgi:3-methyl-2-oxobutanoate hydroxymethyltransferase
MTSPSASLRQKITLNSLRSLYKKGEPITMVTAHDFPSGHVGDAAGMEMILVGDSLAMVALGMDDTSEVLVEEMLLHCRSVARAAKTSFTVRIPFLPHKESTTLHSLGWRFAHGIIRNIS